MGSLPQNRRRVFNLLGDRMKPCILILLLLNAVSGESFSVRGGLVSPTLPSARASKTASISIASTLVGRGGAVAASPSALADSEGVDLVPSTFNLIKNIVGAGVLSLPYGVAAFSNAKGSVLPACALVMALGGLSCYSFILIGRLCEMTGTDTYRDAVNAALGPAASQILALATTLKTLAACLMYSIIIGDTTASLATTMGASAAFPSLFASRWKLLAGVTASVLTPLCLLRSFSFLAYTSLVGIAGTLYTAVFMGMRLLDGTYAPGGRFHIALAEAAAKGAGAAGAVLPSFGSATNPAGAFILLSMLSTAFVAHYNAPRFYNTLKDNTVKRFSKLSFAAFGAAAAIFASIMSFGYLTFGASTQGYVLNNYAATDPLATAARAAILVSIVLGYPLTFVSFRDSVLEIVRGGGGAKDGSKPLPAAVSWRTKDLTGVALLALITVAATFLRNLGLVASVGGAVLGSAVIYIFPALSFIAAAKQEKGSVNRSQEVSFNYALAAIGALLGVIGTVVSLK